MTLRTRMASALSFSHLAGLPKGKTRADNGDDDDDKKQRDGESDDDYAKRMEEQDGDDDQKNQDRENGDAKKGKRADDDDGKGDPDADDQDDADDRKSKKGKKADDSGESEDADDDDPDEEMRGKGSAARARRRERARCAAIFASPHAARNPQMAAQLAFNTTMPRSEAIAVLSAASSSTAVSGRQERNPQLGPGGDRIMTSRQNTERSWEAAMKKVRRQ